MKTQEEIDNLNKRQASPYFTSSYLLVIKTLLIVKEINLIQIEIKVIMFLMILKMKVF
jgi:hypothetical protein